MTRPLDGHGTDASTTNRRAVLRTGLAATGLGLLAGAARGDGGDATDDPEIDAPYAVVQGDRCVPVAPLSGERSVEALYDLRIPDRFAGDNGATDPGTGPYFESLGTRHLQRRNTTITFLYEGPAGPSLVVVHDRPGGSGGAATWDLRVPHGARWVVKDDYYLLSWTDAPAPTNYDRWDTDGSVHTVDWTWSTWATDGGALRGLGEEFAVAIAPRFNEAARLFGEFYDGRIADWQVLSWHGDGPERHSLSLDDPVVVRSGACDPEDD